MNYYGPVCTCTSAARKGLMTRHNNQRLQWQLEESIMVGWEGRKKTGVANYVVYCISKNWVAKTWVRRLPSSSQPVRSTSHLNRSQGEHSWNCGLFSIWCHSHTTNQCIFSCQGIEQKNGRVLRTTEASMIWMIWRLCKKLKPKNFTQNCLAWLWSILYWCRMGFEQIGVRY